jgi:hypothetical protein
MQSYGLLVIELHPDLLIPSLPSNFSPRYCSWVVGEFSLIVLWGLVIRYKQDKKYR